MYYLYKHKSKHTNTKTNKGKPAESTKHKHTVETKIPQKLTSHRKVSVATYGTLQINSQQSLARLQENIQSKSLVNFANLAANILQDKVQAQKTSILDVDTGDTIDTLRKVPSKSIRNKDH